MPYAISYAPSAAKAIRKLDKPTARRLLDVIGALATDPRPPGCIQLKGGGSDIAGRCIDEVASAYSGAMTPPLVTAEARALRALLEGRSDEFHVLLAKYGATNPRLFGSVARGDAHAGSDIDILVEMDPADGNLLMRASGLMEETRQLFGRDDVDVFPVQLLKEPVSREALAEAIAL